MTRSAKKISDDYFQARKYPHNFKSDIIVEMVKLKYNVDSVGKFKPYEKFVLDNVIDYSYDCKVDSEIRQSASLTLYQPKEDSFWYFRRENLSYEDFDPETKHYSAISWDDYLYHLVKKYIYQDGRIEKLDLGYFVVTDSSYDYDATTSTITVTLAGLTARYQTEYGGSITTTRIGHYLPDSQVAAKISAIQKQIKDKTIDPLTGQREIDEIKKQLEQGHGKIEIQFPMAISINKDVDIDNQLFEKFLVYDKKPVWFHKTLIEPPVSGVAVYDLDIWNTPKLYEFDNGVSGGEIVKTLLDDCIQNGCYYIDENLVLHIQRKSPVNYGNCEMLFRDYQNLVIDEKTDASDSGFYNYIEVYGKDGSYFGFCDWSNYDGGQIRKNTMSFSELQTDDECKKRARWETYKARYGHETMSITLADNYIPEFYCPSNLVGSVVEYRMMHGNTNVYTVTGLSYSNNRWTMNLQIFRPLYFDVKTDDIGESSEQKKASMLKKPVIAGHMTEFIDGHILRLYIIGEDIEYGLVRIYYNGRVVGETVQQKEINGTIYKIIDLPVTANLEVHLKAQLYNPRCEPSPMSEMYTYKITGYVDPSENIPEDPYPHPKTEILTYNLATHDSQLLTDTDDNEFVIIERK